MSTRSPVPMEHDPARFKLSLMDLSYSNRLTALVKPVIDIPVFGSFSYYFQTYTLENMKLVILVVPSRLGGTENKEGTFPFFVCPVIINLVALW